MNDRVRPEGLATSNTFTGGVDMTNRVVVESPGQWTLRPTAVVGPAPGQVMLRLVSAGVCGGDLALLAGRNAVARYPLTLGHECVAQIVDRGADVAMSPGQHVVVYPTRSCGACKACLAGLDNQCPEMVVMGLSDPHGCFADVMVVDARQCIPIDDHVAEVHGALIEPLAVASHVVRRSAIEGGERVLVIGAGVIGLATGTVALTSGAASVDCVDRFAGRAPVARSLGFGQCCTLMGDELVTWATDELGQVDVIYDTVVNNDTVGASVRILRPGGRYMAVASSESGQEIALRYDWFFLKELSAIAARNYTREDFRMAARLIEEGRSDLRSLVTGTYPLDDFGRAVGDLRDRPDEHLKVLLTPSRGA